MVPDTPEGTEVPASKVTPMPVIPETPIDVAVVHMEDAVKRAWESVEDMFNRNDDIASIFKDGVHDCLKAAIQWHAETVAGLRVLQDRDTQRRAAHRSYLDYMNALARTYG